MKSPKIEEPLLESAPLAWRLAPQLCNRDTGNGEDCSAMHGAWQYLRALGLVGSIDQRADFYREALAPVAEAATTPSILVCGAADYAMLAQIVAAFRGRNVEPDVTVIDLCETPLMLNRWYADRAACRIKTVREDVLKYGAAFPYDAICTDAFLGRFAPARRPALLAKWRSLLRPGGRIITASRLRAGGAADPVRFSAEQVQRLHASVLSLAGKMRGSLQVDPVELADRAAAFAGSHVTYPVGSAEETRALFEGAGFRLDRFKVAAIAPETQNLSGGPSLRKAGEYLYICASRA